MKMKYKPFRLRPSPLLVVLAVMSACRPEAPAPEKPGAAEPVGSSAARLDPPSGQPMSVTPSTLTGVVQPFPPFEYDNGWSVPTKPRSVDAASAQQVLPFNRGSNDGRLFVRGGCRGCAESTTLYTFRPELLGQDFRYDFASRPDRYVQPDHEPGLHPFVYFNPMATSLPVGNNGFFPDALHGTLCEDSVTSFSAQSHGRNPVACQARYDVGTPLVSGDCYDISLVYGLKAATGPRWELRSVDLTVFVRAPKSVTAGDEVAGGTSGWGLWVYPRHPEGEVKSPPLWELPPFKPFNPHDSPWGDMNGTSTWTNPGTQDINWKRLFTANAGFKCYTEKTLLGSIKIYVRDTSPAAPKWCQFFDRQTYSAAFQVEDDEDGNPNNGGTWNGVSGWPAPGGQERPYALFEPATRSRSRRSSTGRRIRSATPWGTPSRSACATRARTHGWTARGRTSSSRRRTTRMTATTRARWWARTASAAPPSRARSGPLRPTTRTGRRSTRTARPRRPSAWWAHGRTARWSSSTTA
jgi:hypothetical protein